MFFTRNDLGMLILQPKTVQQPKHWCKNLKINKITSPVMTCKSVTEKYVTAFKTVKSK